MRTSAKGRVAALWAALLAGGCAGAPAPAAEGRAQPQQGPQAREFASAEELLGELESADRGLRRLAAEVRYTKVFALDGVVHVRQGRLYFASDPAEDGGPDRRRFAVRFEKFWRDDRLEEDIQEYAFDGQWLIERLPASKEFRLRQVARPGEKFDPLKIGEGPFPLPIGQKREDILAAYDATLVPVADGIALPDPGGASDEERERVRVLSAFVRGCRQVRLVPKAGRDDEFAEVRLWYKRDEKAGRLLPWMARTVAATDEPGVPGDVSIVQMINPRVNERADFDESVFDVRAPDGWQGDVTELDKPKAAR